MAHVLKVEASNVKIKVTSQFSREGSLIAGTVTTTCDSVTTELALESDEPEERVAHLIRMAEASCFTMAALRQSVPCELVATVNHEPFAWAE